MAIYIKAMRGVSCINRARLKKQTDSNFAPNNPDFLFGKVEVIRNTFHEGKFKQHEATIILATDAKVRRLNWWYGAGRETTDVLSFPLRDKPRRKPRIPSSFEKDLATLMENVPFLDPDTGELTHCSRVPPPLTDDLGRIFIAVEYCRQVAKQRQMEHADYITLACAHGMGHLVGLDHQTEDQYKAMKSAEETVLRAVVSEVGLVGDEKAFPQSYLP
ncbi:Metalloprotease catalytic domain containing protein [Gracilaria domingensis]|nr:Metalloprotease catalytic domain containing protein [Gracilaria domingensis]